MKKILSEIQDGSFANEFLDELNSGGKKFRELEAKGEDHLVEHVGKKLRSLFSWIKDRTGFNCAGIADWIWIQYRSKKYENCKDV